MSDAPLLRVQTTLHQYFILREHMAGLKLLVHPMDLTDDAGGILPSAELAPLLDPHDIQHHPRRHALVVRTRRRLVALLVERVDDLVGMQASVVHPLPSLLARRLSYAWVYGVILADEIPHIVLDLRQIAQDALRLGVFH